VIDFYVEVYVHQEVMHIRSYKTRLNCDAELIDFAEQIEFNKECRGKLGIGLQMSVFLFCQGLHDKQQIDYFVVKLRNIGR